MKITVRQYRTSDRSFLVDCMNGMQRHIASIDALKRTRPVSKFNGERWVDLILKKIKKYKGVIFIAEVNEKPAGCVIGIIKESTKIDLIDLFPFKDGRIIELFVDPSFRRGGIGSLLLRNMERFFRSRGCKVAELGTFATNTRAYKFYKKHAYADRNIDMCKKL